MSIRLRIALWYGALFALVLLVVTTFSHAFDARGHYDDLDRAHHHRKPYGSRRGERALNATTHRRKRWLPHDPAPLRVKKSVTPFVGYERSIRRQFRMASGLASTTKRLPSGSLSCGSEYAMDNALRYPSCDRYPQRDSNPCFHLERVMSWASRR